MPVGPIAGQFGAVAQLVAHHTGSVGVRGSSPLSSTENHWPRATCKIIKIRVVAILVAIGANGVRRDVMLSASLIKGCR